MEINGLILHLVFLIIFNIIEQQIIINSAINSGWDTAIFNENGYK